ncbi:MAG: hypothetical protein ACRENA_01120 [Vulcanimicrobiaceae bacterium]
MNVTTLEPDTPLQEAPSVAPLPDASRNATTFENLVDVAGAALDRADAAERAFAEHRGGLIEMMVERANADVMLQLATTAAQRTTQAISTLFGMQV